MYGAPHYEDFNFMTKQAYNKWLQDVAGGKSWNDEIMWYPRIEQYYSKKTNSMKYWQEHVANGGSHWTLFTGTGWQMSPKETRQWKNEIQTGIRRMIQDAETRMRTYNNFDLLSISSEDSASVLSGDV